MSILKKATENLCDVLLPGVTTVTEYDVNLECAWCKRLLRRPRQMQECGHRIDRDCLEHDVPIQSSGKKHCPLCNEVVERHFADNSALRDVLLLECFCLNKSSGCRWQGRVHELEDHVGTCSFTVIQSCPWSFVGCQSTGSAKEIQKHVGGSLVRHHSLFAVGLSEIIRDFDRSSKPITQIASELNKVQADVLVCKNAVQTVQDTILGITEHLKLRGLDTSSIREWALSTQARLDSVGDSISMSEKHVNQVEQLQTTVSSLEANAVLQTRVAMVPTSSRIEVLPGLASYENTISRVEKVLQLTSSELADLELNIRMFQSSTFDGKYVWKLDNLESRFEDAVVGRITELYTPPLYTSTYGFKFSAKVLLNGDNKAEVDSFGRYIAFYFVLMMGDFDEILEFPFRYDVVLSLLDLSGKSHIIKRIEAEPGELPFQKPVKDMNPAIGFPQFCSHEELYSGRYVRDDSIFFRIEVLGL